MQVTQNKAEAENYNEQLAHTENNRRQTAMDSNNINTQSHEQLIKGTSPLYTTDSKKHTNKLVSNR
jgi:hypothetical protein